uniref:acyltransferase family protein n=1 Tax=Crenothrix polyspora TaxID=360316 RepID=UPI0011786B3B|nr:acyltransferase family protein [Crenothrix polyspora]
MERHYLIDNAKIALMFFVVFGHCLELTHNNPMLHSLYLLIYSFHIPMFVLISGMLAKADISSEDLFKQISSLLIPLLVFEVLYEVLEITRFGRLSHYSLNLQPYWLLWFLWSLFLWKLLLSITSCFRFPVIFSLLIAVAAGYSTQIGYFLGLSRTLTFFPFFVLGYTLKPVFFQHLQKYHWLFFAAIILLAAALLNYFNDIDARWFYGSLSYSALGVEQWYAGFIRLFIYGFSFLVGIAVIALLPNKQLKISAYGERTLYIYMWHGFFIILIKAIGLVDAVGILGSWSTLAVLLLLSMLITIVLASKQLSPITEKALFVPVRKILLEDKYLPPPLG